MNEQKRVFIAIDISDEARRKIAAYIGDLRRNTDTASIKFERPEKLHITLKFMGDIDHENLQKVVSAVDLIADRYDSLELEVARTGVFPSAAKPRILWLGLNGGPLASIAKDVEEASEPLGFPSEKREYKPHLTIGRVRQGGNVRSTVEAHLANQFSSKPFTVSRLSIYESRLLRTGSVYSLISEHPLAKTSKS